MRVSLRLARKLSTTIIAAVVSRDVAAAPEVEAGVLRSLRTLRFDIVLPETLGAALAATEYARLLWKRVGRTTARDGNGEANAPPLLSSSSAAWKSLLSARCPDALEHFTTVLSPSQVTTAIIRQKHEALCRLAAQEDEEDYEDRSGGLKNDVSVVLVSSSPENGRLPADGPPELSPTCVVTPEDLAALVSELSSQRDSGAASPAYFPGAAAAEALPSFCSSEGMADAVARAVYALAGRTFMPATASDTLWASDNGEGQITVRTYKPAGKELRIASASGPSAAAHAVTLLGDRALPADFLDVAMGPRTTATRRADGSEELLYSSEGPLWKFLDQVGSREELQAIARGASESQPEPGGSDVDNREVSEEKSREPQEPQDQDDGADAADFSTDCIRFDPTVCTGCQGDPDAGEGVRQRCVLACKEGGIKCLLAADESSPPLQARGASGTSTGLTVVKLVEAGCNGCGACVQTCPRGAFSTSFNPRPILAALHDDTRAAVAIVDPLIQGCGAETPDDDFSPSRTVATLRRMGFAAVYDARCGAQLVVQAIAERIRSAGLGISPILSSDCPGFVSMVREKQPDLSSHLASLRTPAEILAALIKRNWGKISFEGGVNGPGAAPFIAYIGTCIPQKAFVGGSGDAEDRVIDAVLTAGDLATLQERSAGSGASDDANDQKASSDADSCFTKPFHKPSAACAGYGLPGALSDAVIDYLKTSENSYADFNEDGAALSEATEVKETQLWASKDGSQQILTRRITIGSRKYKFLIAEGGRAAEKAAGMVVAEKITCDLLDARICPGGCVRGYGRPKAVDSGQSAAIVTRLRDLAADNDDNENGLTTETACARIKQLLSGEELVTAMARVYR